MRIAIDFDMTVFNKKTGQIDNKLAQKINQLFDSSHEITIYTTRADDNYSTVKAILDLAKVKYTRIVCGKVQYDVLLDDRAKSFDQFYDLELTKKSEKK